MTTTAHKWSIDRYHQIVFWDLIDGEYREELTLTTGSIQPRSFPDTNVDVQRYRSTCRKILFLFPLITRTNPEVSNGWFIRT